MTRRLPSERYYNQHVSGPAGEPVVLFEVVDVRPGNELTITFEESHSDWRQGVWIATAGSLETSGVSSPQFTLWEDTAPTPVRVRVIATDGLLRLYNVWNSWRGYSDQESQSATSGMLVEERAHRSRRYRCNDIGFAPKFDKLVFSLTIE